MNALKFFDPVYGHCEIREPVLVELARSPALERLKDIDQAGYSRAWFPGAEHTRYDHSMGVAVLLARFGASVAEQAAGLIHDVSHTAFSHCADYVLDEGSQAEQSFQDDVFQETVRGTDIPSILSRHGLDPETVLREENFPLLEKDLPDLCADRIDYILRAGHHFKAMDPDQIRGYLDGLVVQDDTWVFRDRDAAASFARAFMDINKRFFSGLTSASMFSSVGAMVRLALDKGRLKREDLFRTDSHVVDILASFAAEADEAAILWRRMNAGVEVAHDTNEYHDRVVCKSRVVDPWCVQGPGLSRLSKLDPEYRNLASGDTGPKTWCLRFSD